ncbi:hypothetical protein BJD20_13250 [Acinetobacter proteolyticus]|uniref:hypothetical protein n=1 Tax=Acinetobacter proteolyticus TaxID=1776741 RepID=UPI00086328BB|nr:hypothetical protein [Acinetobacter proteolyticus]OEY96065.1 hypothetical protein BJD20_13250 [Acinetobacter proteolyticus]
MNAIQFIKDHGVEKARDCIEEANAYGGFWVNAKTLELSKQIPSYNAVSIPDIQRLVESVDLVNDQGGLLWARTHVSLSKARSNYIEAERLEQAIADYEAIYGGEHV